MTFLWPHMLWLLLIVPLLLAAYRMLLLRKKKLAVRYASLSIVKEAMGPGQRWRRHLPPLLFLLALTAMLFAIARPAALVTLPSQFDTVILAIDTSVSMRANDVAPSRIAAAQAAARKFVSEQPINTRIGVVSFAGTAAVAQHPTQNRQDILSAIDTFQLQRGTAVGSGMLVSLKMIFPDIEFDLQASNPRISSSQNPSPNSAASQGLQNSGAAPLTDSTVPKAQPKPVAPGSFTSAAIILLTDGQTTTGPDPLEAARMAAERGVRVFTVGVGTVNGEILGAEGWSLRVRLDEESLRQIANITNAEYFYAGTATDLSRVYQTLNSRLVMEKKETEITALFTGLAALLAAMSGLLSMLWFNRIL